VISRWAVVEGSAPPSSERAAYDRVAFVGIVPVKLRGGVKAGMLVVPSGREDGTAVAVATATEGLAPPRMRLGRAQEPSAGIDARAPAAQPGGGGGGGGAPPRRCGCCYPPRWWALVSCRRQADSQSSVNGRRDRRLLHEMQSLSGDSDGHWQLVKISVVNPADSVTVGRRHCAAAVRSSWCRLVALWLMVAAVLLLLLLRSSSPHQDAVRCAPLTLANGTLTGSCDGALGGTCSFGGCHHGFRAESSSSRRREVALGRPGPTEGGEGSWEPPPPPPPAARPRHDRYYPVCEHCLGRGLHCELTDGTCMGKIFTPGGVAPRAGHGELVDECRRRIGRTQLEVHGARTRDTRDTRDAHDHSSSSSSRGGDAAGQRRRPTPAHPLAPSIGTLRGNVTVCAATELVPCRACTATAWDAGWLGCELSGSPVWGKQPPWPVQDAVYRAYGDKDGPPPPEQADAHPGAGKNGSTHDQAACSRWDVMCLSYSACQWAFRPQCSRVDRPSGTAGTQGKPGAIADCGSEAQSALLNLPSTSGKPSWQFRRCVVKQEPGFGPVPLADTAPNASTAAAPALHPRKVAAAAAGLVTRPRTCRKCVGAGCATAQSAAEYSGPAIACVEHFCEPQTVSALALDVCQGCEGKDALVTFPRTSAAAAMTRGQPAVVTMACPSSHTGRLRFSCNVSGWTYMAGLCARKYCSATTVKLAEVLAPEAEAFEDFFRDRAITWSILPWSAYGQEWFVSKQGFVDQVPTEWSRPGIDVIHWDRVPEGYRATVGCPFATTIPAVGRNSPAPQLCHGSMHFGGLRRGASCACAGSGGGGGGGAASRAGRAELMTRMLSGNVTRECPHNAERWAAATAGLCRYRTCPGGPRSVVINATVVQIEAPFLRPGTDVRQSCCNVFTKSGSCADANGAFGTVRLECGADGVLSMDAEQSCHPGSGVRFRWGEEGHRSGSDDVANASSRRRTHRTAISSATQLYQQLRGLLTGTTAAAAAAAACPLCAAVLLPPGRKGDGAGVGLAPVQASLGDHGHGDDHGGGDSQSSGGGGGGGSGPWRGVSSRFDSRHRRTGRALAAFARVTCREFGYRRAPIVFNCGALAAVLGAALQPQCGHNLGRGAKSGGTPNSNCTQAQALLARLCPSMAVDLGSSAKCPADLVVSNAGDVPEDLDRVFAHGYSFDNAVGAVSQSSDPTIWKAARARSRQGPSGGLLLQPGAPSTVSSSSCEGSERRLWQCFYHDLEQRVKYPDDGRRHTSSCAEQLIVGCADDDAAAAESPTARDTTWVWPSSTSTTGTGSDSSALDALTKPTVFATVRRPLMMPTLNCCCPQPSTARAPSWHACRPAAV
jgi:hypothetical protein